MYEAQEIYVMGGYNVIRPGGTLTEEQEKHLIDIGFQLVTGHNAQTEFEAAKVAARLGAVVPYDGTLFAPIANK